MHITLNYTDFSTHTIILGIEGFLRDNSFKERTVWISLIKYLKHKTKKVFQHVKF